MSYESIFLPLITYPNAPPAGSVDAAVAFAASFSAKMTAVAFEADIVAPGNLLTKLFLNLPAIVAAEEKKSADAAELLLARFCAAAEKAGVFQEVSHERHLLPNLRDAIAEHARLHDLAVLPVGKVDLADQWCAEAVIFESGRPVLVLPHETGQPVQLRFDSVTVAYDFSRASARVLGDALPILRQAGRVSLLTVFNEKSLTKRHAASEVIAYLKKHSIAADALSIDADGRSIGQVLAGYVASEKPDLLVMGAYGHSRMREFILGGATRSMLSNPSLPIFLSH